MSHHSDRDSSVIRAEPHTDIYFTGLGLGGGLMGGMLLGDMMGGGMGMGGMGMGMGMGGMGGMGGKLCLNTTSLRGRL